MIICEVITYPSLYSVVELGMCINFVFGQVVYNVSNGTLIFKDRDH